MLSVAEKFIKAFNEKEIRYCHYKGNNHIEDGLNGVSDLDILVDEEQKKLCTRTLKEAGFVKFKSQLGAAFDVIEDWLSVDGESGSLVHIHLYYQIITGKKYAQEYRLPWEKHILDTRVQDFNHGGIYITSKEAEFALVYALMCLKKEKSISEKNQQKIDFFKPAADEEKLSEFLHLVMGDEDAEKFKGILGRYYNMQKTYDVISKYAVKRHSPFAAELKNRWTEKLIKGKMKLNRKFKKNYTMKKTLYGKGFSVCFVGADGSGKSTVSENIIKWISWKAEAKRFYLGSGDHYSSIWKTILRKVGGRKKNVAAPSETPKTETPKTETSANKKKKFSILSYGIAIINCFNEVTIAKYKYKTLKQAEKYMNKGGIAVFDRFPQVQFDGIFDGPKLDFVLKKFPKSILVNYFYKKERKYLKKATDEYCPDLLFKLILPPEESIRRKPDHNFKEISLKAEITEKLEFPSSQIIKIDATKDFDSEMTEVKNIIWQKIESI